MTTTSHNISITGPGVVVGPSQQMSKSFKITDPNGVELSITLPDNVLSHYQIGSKIGKGIDGLFFNITTTSTPLKPLRGFVDSATIIDDNKTTDTNSNVSTNDVDVDGVAKEVAMLSTKSKTKCESKPVCSYIMKIGFLSFEERTNIMKILKLGTDIIPIMYEITEVKSYKKTIETTHIDGTTNTTTTTVESKDNGIDDFGLYYMIMERFDCLADLVWSNEKYRVEYGDRVLTEIKKFYLEKMPESGLTDYYISVHNLAVTFNPTVSVKLIECYDIEVGNDTTDKTMILRRHQKQLITLFDN
jgi:hypothetical protein